MLATIAFRGDDEKADPLRRVTAGAVARVGMTFLYLGQAGRSMLRPYKESPRNGATARVAALPDFFRKLFRYKSNGGLTR